MNVVTLIGIDLGFVTPRNEAQQTLSALHRVREGLVLQRTAATNQIHAFLLEFGISLPNGPAVIKRLPAVLALHPELPVRRVAVLERLRAHFTYLDEQIAEVERELAQQLKEDESSHSLLEIPGIGPITPVR